MKLLVAIGFLLASAGTAAGEPPASDDNTIARLGGGTLLFEQAIQDEVVGNAEVKVQFDRLGLEQACSIYNRSLDAVVEVNSTMFKSLLADALRRHVPADVLTSSIRPGLDHPPLIAYQKRILDSLHATAGPLFASSRRDLRNSFLAISKQTEMPGGAGMFADWDLENPSARKTACLLLRNPETLARKKLLFDGFLKRKD